MPSPRRPPDARRARAAGRRSHVALALAVVAAAPAAQAPPDAPPDMPALVERYATDASALARFYDIDTSATRLDRLDAFDDGWRDRLASIDFDALDTAGRIDHVLLRLHLEHEAQRRDELRRRLATTGELLPFAEAIIGLEEARWRLEPVDPAAAAEALDRVAETAERITRRVRAAGGPAHDERADGDAAAPEVHAPEPDDGPPVDVDPVVARRVAAWVDELAATLTTWHDDHAEYEPGFAWWTDAPFERSRKALEAYAKKLRETIAGLKGEDDDPLIGDPIGRDALLADLAHEMIPYSPEELLAIGEAQLQWCTDAMRDAAAELGDGDDWHAALAHVKSLHAPPGGQDDLVAAQAREAIAFLDAHDLVTIPELCRETWRLRMIDRETQRTLPFAAYGGQVMLVAFPTSDMTQQAKLMAMRGNNEHFTRIVTPHELIPGHHLQGFMAQRHATHRGLFSTPFLGEGWALYWEMVLWDRGWARGPEDRIGMLFWRMHRAARILVSLRFHLGEMTPAEMIDFLVDRVGHERDGATSEVRRYIAGDYSPLYQCAYMIGGLQLRALHDELVGRGGWTDRQFHDAVLRQGPIPVELIRAALLDVPPAVDARARWRFAGDP